MVSSSFPRFSPGFPGFPQGNTGIPLGETGKNHGETSRNAKVRWGHAFSGSQMPAFPWGLPGESRHSGLSPGVLPVFPRGKPVFQNSGIQDFGRPGFWWVDNTWISPGETQGFHQGKVGLDAPLVFPWGKAAAPLFPWVSPGRVQCLVKGIHIMAFTFRDPKCKGTSIQLLTGCDCSHPLYSAD